MKRPEKLDTLGEVEAAVRFYLAQPHFLAGGTTTTTLLGMEIMPASADKAKVQHVFKALQTLAEGRLSDCATRGPPMMRYGKEVRRLQWHKSDGSVPRSVLCSKCGQALPKETVI